MHQIRYTYLFSPFVFSFSKVLSFDDLTIAPSIGNVNKNFMLKLCNLQKNRSVYKQDSKGGKDHCGKSAQYSSAQIVDKHNNRYENRKGCEKEHEEFVHFA